MSGELPPQEPGVIERLHVDKIIGVLMALIGFSLAGLLSLGIGTMPPGSSTAAITPLFLGALLLLVLGLVIVNQRPLLRRELRRSGRLAPQRLHEATTVPQTPQLPPRISDSRGSRSVTARLLAAAAATATLIALFRYLGDGIVFGRPDWTSFGIATAVIWTCYLAAMRLTRKPSEPR